MDDDQIEHRLDAIEDRIGRLEDVLEGHRHPELGSVDQRLARLEQAMHAAAYLLPGKVFPLAGGENTEQATHQEITQLLMPIHEEIKYGSAYDE